MADAEFEIAMPFVTVASKGGPHDDGSYVHGYEMGKLDQLLTPGFEPRVEFTVHEANLPQADLIAMRQNYRMELVTASDGWVEVEFIQNGEIVPDVVTTTS